MAQTSGSLDSRVPFPGLNAFRGFVKDELARRKQSLASSVVVPFVRLTACTMDAELKRMFFTVGLHGFDETDIDIFDQSYGGGRDIVGYSYDMNSKDVNGFMKKRLHSSDQITADALQTSVSSSLTPRLQTKVQEDREALQVQQSLLFANSAHPIPGITSVSVERKGPHAPFTSNVTFQCYNRAQLEFLRNHLMIVGQYVVLEWGNQFVDKQLSKILNFGDAQNVKLELVNSVQKGRQYVIDNWVQPNDGNYDFIVGTIGNFQVTLDSNSGIYNCSVTIVSVGESIYGVNTHFTYVRTDDTITSQNNQVISTIADYFKIGNGFDDFIYQHQNSTDLVAPMFAHYGLNEGDTNTTSQQPQSQVSTNPQDYRFISWKFFVKDIIPEVFGIINGNNVNNTLSDRFDFGYDKNGNPTDESLPIDKQNWVGDNDWLLTTDPDAMIIVKTVTGEIPRALTGAGKFDVCTGSDGHRGKLGNGIWLNVGMIRRSFLENNDIVSIIKAVLQRMNNATANFWKLSLIWDDEIAKFRIVDQNFTDGKRILPEFFKFNSFNDQGDSNGELLKIELDSAFPPELVTQMMLYAKYRSESPAERQQLSARFPKIGTTSTFVFSLNWTNLQDVLAPEIRASQENSTNAVAHAAIQNNSQPVRNRIASNGNGQSAVPVVTGGSPTKRGQPVGATNPTHNTDAAQNVDNSIVTLPPNKARPPRAKRQNIARDRLADGRGFATNSFDVLVPDFRIQAQKYVARLQAAGYVVTVNQTGRDVFQSLANVRSGSTSSNIGRNPSASPHIYGRAMDISIFKNGQNVTGDPTVIALKRRIADDLTKEGPVAVRTGDGIILSSGLPDYPHFEMIGNVSTVPQIPPEVLYNEGSKYEDVTVRPGKPGFLSLGKDYQPASPTQTTIPPDQEATNQKVEDVVTRFNNATLSLYQPNASVMINLITKDGFDNYPSPNGYVYGFPTTTAVTIEILGMSGISISDCFFVDRLPFIFERYGVFQVIEITETIDDSGWLTKIKGYFKLLKVDQ